MDRSLARSLALALVRCLDLLVSLVDIFYTWLEFIMVHAKLLHFIVRRKWYMRAKLWSPFAMDRMRKFDKKGRSEWREWEDGCRWRWGNRKAKWSHIDRSGKMPYHEHCVYVTVHTHTITNYTYTQRYPMNFVLKLIHFSVCRENIIEKCTVWTRDGMEWKMRNRSSGIPADLVFDF